MTRPRCGPFAFKAHGAHPPNLTADRLCVLLALLARPCQTTHRFGLLWPRQSRNREFRLVSVGWLDGRVTGFVWCDLNGQIAFDTR
jgi:hypothetical protein